MTVERLCRILFLWEWQTHTNTSLKCLFISLLSNKTDWVIIIYNLYRYTIKKITFKNQQYIQTINNRNCFFGWNYTLYIFLEVFYILYIQYIFLVQWYLRNNGSLIMTICYSSEVETCNGFGCFPKLLLR